MFVHFLVLRTLQTCLFRDKVIQFIHELGNKNLNFVIGKIVDVIWSFDVDLGKYKRAAYGILEFVSRCCSVSVSSGEFVHLLLG